MRTRIISFAVLFSTLSLVWVAEEAFAQGRRSYYESRIQRYVERKEAERRLAQHYSYLQNIAPITYQCLIGRIPLSDPGCRRDAVRIQLTRSYFGL